MNKMERDTCFPDAYILSEKKTTDNQQATT